MNMWMTIFAVVALILGGGICYISSRIVKFTFWQKFFQSRKSAFFFAALLTVLMLLILWQCIGLINAGVCLIHVFFIWLLCDLVTLALRHFMQKKHRRYFAGAAALLFSVIWLLYGYFNCSFVRRTEYYIPADLSEKFTVIGFSDSHMGTVFHGEQLKEYVSRMNAEDADIAVIVGDLVDDGTTREEMLSACRALSALKTRYGIYYVFGNHDGGYYSASRRGYSSADLISALTENGVTVLQDDVVPLRDGISLAGRLDGQYRSRLSAEQLTYGLDKEDYIIMLDHEPTDYASETASGADLVISGHTHGGQFFPFRRLVALLGSNELLYGHEKRGSTDFIVSSGIADWELKFKTGCVSEYFVINIG